MPRNGYILFLVILVATALFVSRAFSADDQASEMRTLERIINTVERQYVEPVKPHKLYEGAYRGVLSVLDPYTQYFDKQESTTFTEDTEGEFGGLGVEIGLKDGILTVISPIRGTPAWDAGIQPGDMFLKIDGQSTEGINMNDALTKLRGKIGTSVTLTVRHVNSQNNVDITITRAKIQPKAVDYEMLDSTLGIGLVRLTTFNAHATKDMSDGIEDLKKQGLKGLVLDLRGNPGGLLTEAADTADLFLSSGTIVSVKGRTIPPQRYEAKPGQEFEQIPLVVLVDEGSASASEILAAALKDNGRALLVGQRTYGKGSVQNVFSLGNGETLKMTTARYYRPNDQPILDRQGIIPDIVIPLSQPEKDALRMQEREDKLRGVYTPGGLLQETPDTAAPSTENKPAGGEETPAAPDDQQNRRSRVVDQQLRGAVNALKWQLTTQK